MNEETLDDVVANEGSVGVATGRTPKYTRSAVIKGKDGGPFNQKNHKVTSKENEKPNQKKNRNSGRGACCKK